MKLYLLSGFALEKAGWEQDGRLYKRGVSVIEFDGVKWFLNKKEITGDDVPEEIITKPPPAIFSPKVPSDLMTDKERREYYERMMENK